METNKIYNGNCVEKLKEIESVFGSQVYQLKQQISELNQSLNDLKKENMQMHKWLTEIM